MKHRLLVLLLAVLFNLGFAGDVPKLIRQEYATKFYDAFVLQSRGKPYTTASYYLFKAAFTQAREAGESIQKLQVLDELFRWYRKYGYSLGLMGAPSGCTDEYRCGCWSTDWNDKNKSSFVPCLSSFPNYRSEYGKTPQEAALVRDFMFGVGETISGVLCITIGSVPVSGIGINLTLDGCLRMYNAASKLYVQYEAELYEESFSQFKKWEKKAKAVSGP